jgi:hypothetical protein
LAPCGLVCLAAWLISGSAAAEDRFPDPSQLAVIAGLPDPLVMLDGQKVTTREDWFQKRAPELRALFQHYMYGYFPPRPEKIEAALVRSDAQALGGKATLKEVTIHFGPKGTPPINLLVVVPNRRQAPAPVFLGINFCGNHMALPDPKIALPQVWMPNRCPGCKDNKATDEGRGAQVDVWSIEGSIDRGYAVATFYHGDLDPDKHDFTDGVHPHYFKPGQREPGPHDWGTIAAWAFGFHRCVDYLVQDPDIDRRRIAVVGHSRNGKTALLAAAFDERIALAIPHQAGCGGTAPSRGTVGESVKQINTSFPHWFCDEFTKFNEQPQRLPFDQHCLVALCAPRPVLFSNAVEDTWANPAGQFEVLKAAEPVYRLLGAGGVEAETVPPPGQLVNSTLGYYIRPGKHSMTSDDWKVFWEFAEKHLK